jgi:hypothetical protein
MLRLGRTLGRRFVIGYSRDVCVETWNVRNVSSGKSVSEDGDGDGIDGDGGKVG